VTFVVLFILAVVWAVYLASWLRSRSETRSVDSISSFSRHLSILERTGPGARPSAFGARRGARTPRPTALPGTPVVRRPSMSASKKRRKDILTGLLAFTGVSALAGLFVGGTFRPIFVLALLLTGAYVALLAQAQKRVLERRNKVRYLGTAAPARRPVASSPVTQPAAWSDDEQAVDEWYAEEADGTYGTYGYAEHYTDGERYAAARS